MTKDKPVSLYKQAEPACLSLHSRFKFHCQGDLPCFNQCCRAPTIILSPYDILRLKNFLGISSGEFLERYTGRVTEERSNLPLIFLDPYRSAVRGCPFVGAGGCTVYAHRPAACRLFPITMGSQLTDQGVADYYFSRRLTYCRGFAGDVEWTVASWRASQGFDEYDQERRQWLEILLKQGLKGPEGVDARLQDLFATLAYDLDEFRRRLSEPGFLPDNVLEGEDLEELQSNDLTLLRFAYRGLKAVRWGEEDPGPGD
jgi:Fe-S-cluster containining protein